MEARETPRLPEDIEAEQRYLAELKSERFQTALKASAEIAAPAVDANMQALSELDILSRPAAPTAPQQVTSPLAAAEGQPSRVPVDDSDEAALELLRELGLDQSEDGKAPKYGVIYRFARWLDELIAAIFRRPTF